MQGRIILNLFIYTLTIIEEMIITILIHRGMTPAAADLSLLETARRCELYGIKMHPGKVNLNIWLTYKIIP